MWCDPAADIALGPSRLPVLTAPLVLPGHEEYSPINVGSPSLQFCLEMTKPGESLYLTRVVWVLVGNGTSAGGVVVYHSPPGELSGVGNVCFKQGK